MSHQSPLDTSGVIEVASFRAALRSFPGDSDRLARLCGLTPLRHLLLVMIKGALTETSAPLSPKLADRLKVAQNAVTGAVIADHGARHDNPRDRSRPLEGAEGAAGPRLSAGMDRWEQQWTSA